MTLSMTFLIVLFVVLAVDYLVALFSGGNSAESKDKMTHLLQRYILILFGYAAIALIAFLFGRKFPAMEYVGGLLLDPIFRYTVSLLDRLKFIMTRNKKEDKDKEKAKEKDNSSIMDLFFEKEEDPKIAEKAAKAASVSAKSASATRVASPQNESTVEKVAKAPAKSASKTTKAASAGKSAVTSKSATVKRPDPIMIEIEPMPQAEAPIEKPKAKPRTRKAVKS